VNTRLGDRRLAQKQKTQRINLSKLFRDRFELGLGVALGRERDELPANDD
jgi:hypothetical protein